MFSMPSLTTQRKLRAIEETFGKDWKQDADLRSLSIDALYNRVIGDGRKNVFCKMSSEGKDHLDEMVDEYGITMADLLERLVHEQYDKFVKYRDHSNKKLLNAII